MGFINNLFKDLSEAGSPASKLRGRFATLSKYLSDYSYGESNYSKELTHQKIIVTYNEAIEIAKHCTKDDTVRLYFTSQTVEPKVDVALKAAEYWIDFVMDQNRQFTSGLAIQLIDRAENDLHNGLGQSPLSSSVTKSSEDEKLGDRLPNFILFMSDVASVMENCHLIKNNSKIIEYKAPILTFGRIMGYNHFIVTEENHNLYSMSIMAIGNDGVLIESSKQWFSLDSSFEDYNTLLNSLMMEIMSSPKYMKIATG